MKMMKKTSLMVIALSLATNYAYGALKSVKRHLPMAEQLDPQTQRARTARKLAERNIKRLPKGPEKEAFGRRLAELERLAELKRLAELVGATIISEQPTTEEEGASTETPEEATEEAMPEPSAPPLEEEQLNASQLEESANQLLGRMTSIRKLNQLEDQFEDLVRQLRELGAIPTAESLEKKLNDIETRFGMGV